MCLAEKVANYAHSRQLHIVGYYQAPERVGDTTLSAVGERVACKIKESFETPVALVVSLMGYCCRIPSHAVVTRPTGRWLQVGRRKWRGTCRTSARRYCILSFRLTYH